MYADHTLLATTGQIVMAGFFIFQGVKNITRRRINVERMTALGVPKPALCLAIGFAIQFTGAFLVLIDIYTRLGAVLLILFTLIATSVFHRYWRMEDPMRAEYHFLLLTYNVFVVGALLLIM